MQIETAKNRFGLGGKPNEITPNNPKQWLEAQIASFNPRPSILANYPKSSVIFAEVAETQANRRQTKNGKARPVATPLAEPAYNLRRHYIDAVNARAQIAIQSETPFMERMVHFWANHFAISADGLYSRASAGSYEFEAIRPKINGSFFELLLSVVTHPTMLDYLNQNRSIGPNTQAAQRRSRNNPERQFGLNENLAREILELHTLGVHGGYSQADVTEFAKALTGFTVATRRPIQGANQGEPGTFIFIQQIHEPGSRKIMGKTYNQQNHNQALAILRDLSIHPSTAQNIATKLARHFTSDNPPEALIARLKANFIATNGDLPSLYKTLINAPEFEIANASKFKTPWDWFISSMRGLGFSNSGDVETAIIMRNLGQEVWQPKSPKGFDDIDAAWAAPDALTRRLELAWQLAIRAKTNIGPLELANKLLGANLDEHTKTTISRAESPASGYALLIVSPAFLRR